MIRNLEPDEKAFFMNRMQTKLQRALDAFKFDDEDLDVELNVSCKVDTTINTGIFLYGAAGYYRRSQGHPDSRSDWSELTDKTPSTEIMTAIGGDPPAPSFSRLGIMR